MDPLLDRRPRLTQYELIRVIGERLTQLSAGATPTVKVPEHMYNILKNNQLEPIVIREILAGTCPINVHRGDVKIPVGDFSLNDVDDLLASDV